MLWRLGFGGALVASVFAFGPAVSLLAVFGGWLCLLLVQIGRDEKHGG